MLPAFLHVFAILHVLTVKRYNMPVSLAKKLPVTDWREASIYNYAI